MKRGFDTKKYLNIERNDIIKRAGKYARFYFEVGGHLAYDGHASRVLPGYNPKTKLILLKNLSGKINTEIVYCVNANDLESRKLLGDFKLNYKKQTLKDINDFSKNGLKINHIVITRCKKYNKSLNEFIKTIEKKVKNIYLHYEIPNYTKSPKYALAGYKKDSPLIFNPKTKLIIITGAAGGSGKMATAMSQIYHDLTQKPKLNSGYAKLETFPVWNLPLNHPINLAYEAATADLQDKNSIDPYHLKYYKIKAVNYNRDIDNFSILIKIAKLITKKKFPFGYKSPTDMGIGNTKSGIISDSICRESAIKEIHRRMKVYENDFKNGRTSIKTLNRMKEILKKIK